MKLMSLAFVDQGDIPNKYSCHGEGVNPPLAIEDVPAGTRSLALVVDDPDAPSGDFVHWLLWNIPSDADIIEEDSVPVGSVVGVNSMGSNDYIAPCPPSGTHRYQFKLYALDTQLECKSNTEKADLLAAMQEHVLEETILTGLFSANK